MIKKIIINNRKYKLKVVSSTKEKKIGLSNIKKIKKNEGMLFCYDSEVSNRSFTMKNTNFDLKIIFLNKNFNIVYAEKGKKRSNKSIVCPKPSQYVIEIPV